MFLCKGTSFDLELPIIIANVVKRANSGAEGAAPDYGARDTRSIHLTPYKLHGRMTQVNSGAGRDRPPCTRDTRSIYLTPCKLHAGKIQVNRGQEGGGTCRRCFIRGFHCQLFLQFGVARIELLCFQFECVDLGGRRTATRRHACLRPIRERERER